MASIDSSLKPTSHAPVARGTILFADDEAVLREVASAALERAGYAVLLASSADEAARSLDENRDIALAVLDWSMPGASGAALLERARASHPGLRIVISSGAIDDDVRALQRRDAALHILHKPWRARALVGLIESILT